MRRDSPAFLLPRSGILDSLYRDQAEALIQSHGGRVTKAVSGRTNFLLVGTEAGKSKVQAAKVRRQLSDDSTHRGERTSGHGVLDLRHALREQQRERPPASFAGQGRAPD